MYVLLAPLLTLPITCDDRTCRNSPQCLQHMSPWSPPLVWIAEHNTGTCTGDMSQAAKQRLTQQISSEGHHNLHLLQLMPTCRPSAAPPCCLLHLIPLAAGLDQISTPLRDFSKSSLFSAICIISELC